jgi:3-hydroxybutyryl-CoA dehydrogenase
MNNEFKIAVIGSGTMGNGIAHVSAQSGFKTLLVDIDKNQLKKALEAIDINLDRQIKKKNISQDEKINTLNNLELNTDLKKCSDSDLVIEAVPEKYDLKVSIFKKLDKICDQKTIFASNTSSISISDLGNKTKRATKFIGMHFMNPVPIMKLVEVINTIHTSEQTTKKIIEISELMKKTPIQCNDYPGFVSNRILMPMINEAIFCLEQNVATKESIDGIMKLGMSHPMGPLQLADFIGLDVCLDIMEVLWNGFNDSKYRPCTLLKSMVSSGLLGKKTGRGFYTYD